MKMILSHLIADYEFQLVDPTARPFLTLGHTRLPSPFTTVLVRKLAVGSDGESESESEKRPSERC